MRSLSLAFLLSAAVASTGPTVAFAAPGKAKTGAAAKPAAAPQSTNARNNARGGRGVSKVNPNCGNGRGRGGADGAGLGNGRGNTCAQDRGESP